MIEAFLLAIVLTIVIVTVTIAVLVGVFSWQLAKSNRVVPDVAGTAPVVWLWSPTQAARLHRRLRNAVRILPRPAPVRRGRHNPAATPHSELARTVASQAVAVDHHLVVASRLSRPQRRRHLHALTPQVAEIERLSLRLMHQHRQVSQPATIGGSHPQAASTPEVLADIDRRLDRLDDAHRELTAIERERGLLDPDEVLAQIARPAPAPAPLSRPSATRPAPTSASHPPAPVHPPRRTSP